jgi:CheY-like chemotaxis protein
MIHGGYAMCLSCGFLAPVTDREEDKPLMRFRSVKPSQRSMNVSEEFLGSKYSVLLVEDTLSGEERCRDLLGSDFLIIRAANAHLAGLVLEEWSVQGRNFDAAIVDLTLERDYEDGLPVIRALRIANTKLPILIWSKHSDQVISEALLAGANRALKKYVNDRDLGKVLIAMINEEDGSLSEQ